MLIFAKGLDIEDVVCFPGVVSLEDIVKLVVGCMGSGIVAINANGMYFALLERGVPVIPICFYTTSSNIVMNIDF